MNWCSRTPKNGSSLPLPARCFSVRLATRTRVFSALRQSRSSTPELPRRSFAASERLRGVARIQGPLFGFRFDAERGLGPDRQRVGLKDGVRCVVRVSAPIAAASLGLTVSADCIGSVRRSSVSMTTSVAWIVVANSFEAMSATTSRPP